MPGTCLRRCFHLHRALTALQNRSGCIQADGLGYLPLLGNACHVLCELLLVLVEGLLHHGRVGSKLLPFLCLFFRQFTDLPVRFSGLGQSQSLFLGSFALQRHLIVPDLVGRLRRRAPRARPYMPRRSTSPTMSVVVLPLFWFFFPFRLLAAHGKLPEARSRVVAGQQKRSRCHTGCPAEPDSLPSSMALPTQASVPRRTLPSLRAQPCGHWGSSNTFRCEPSTCLHTYIHTCAHKLLAYVCILYLFGARGVCRSQAVLRCKLLERQSSLGAFLRSDLQGSGKLQRPQQFSALAVALRFGCRVLFSQGRESQCILLRRGVVTAAACSYNCDAGFAGPPLEFAIAALPAVLDGQGAHGLPQNPRPCMFLGHPRCLGGKKPTP